MSYLVVLGADEDLLNWIVSIQPELILLFERDRFSARRRAGLFIKLMEQLKKITNGSIWTIRIAKS